MFLLIEDETGVTNVIVLPPVYDRDRLTVRTASLVSVAGKLERREGVINVVAEAVDRLEVPADAVAGKVRHIEPPAHRETGRDAGDAYAAERAGRLAAVAPRAHSFGRRG